MAHFAELDENNMVIRVIVVGNKDTADEQSNEVEQIGIDFLTRFSGHTNWKQTSYNSHAGTHSLGESSLRKNYAGIGHTYDSGRDAFVPPKPFTSWIIDEEKGLWKAPKAYPQDGKDYEWNENIPDWVEAA